MRNSRICGNWGVFFLGMAFVLIFFSWIGSVYGVGEVQSLLSAEGMRWMLGHVVEDYVQTPVLGNVMVLMMGLGVGAKAGMYNALKRFLHNIHSLSRKERRALMLSVVVWWAYVLLMLLVMLFPWSFLLSVTGSWNHSPLLMGSAYLFSLGMGITGMVYGCISDVFKRVSDVFESMSFLLARHASYFVTLFLVVQCFGFLNYTQLDTWLGLSEEAVAVLFNFSCYFPLLYDLIVVAGSQKKSLD